MYKKLEIQVKSALKRANKGIETDKRTALQPRKINGIIKYRKTCNLNAPIFLSSNTHRVHEREVNACIRT